MTMHNEFIDTWFDASFDGLEYACWLGMPMTDYRGNFN